MKMKQKNTTEKLKKSNKGITLIALVITIIVLLILAGVTIATLTGDNGLLTKAGEAKEKNTEASVLEKIQVEVAGSYGLDGKIDLDKLNENLKNINDLKYNNSLLSNNNKITEFPAIVELNQFYYQIKNNGLVNNVILQSINKITKDNYGDYIDLGQSVVGTSETTDDWRILYNDTVNNVVYAILADYLPNNNEAVTASGLNVISGTTYNVNSSTNGVDLVNRLNNTTAWQTLIPEKLRTTCQVNGGVRAQILMNSYNEKYSINPAKVVASYSYFYIDNDSTKGIDTLYMPHPGNKSYDGCDAYWLASKYTDSTAWSVGIKREL